MDCYARNQQSHLSAPDAAKNAHYHNFPVSPMPDFSGS